MQNANDGKEFYFLETKEQNISHHVCRISTNTCPVLLLGRRHIHLPPLVFLASIYSGRAVEITNHGGVRLNLDLTRVLTSPLRLIKSLRSERPIKL